MFFIPSRPTARLGVSLAITLRVAREANIICGPTATPPANPFSQLAVCRRPRRKTSGTFVARTHSLPWFWPPGGRGGTLAALGYGAWRWKRRGARPLMPV